MGRGLPPFPPAFCSSGVTVFSRETGRRSPAVVVRDPPRLGLPREAVRPCPRPVLCPRGAVWGRYIVEPSSSGLSQRRKQGVLPKSDRDEFGKWTGKLNPG